jgi:endonuclease/exonuclease/phosphatase family protein
VNNYDVFCITETLLKENHQTLLIPNYYIFKTNCSLGDRGIAMLVKNNFKITQIVSKIKPYNNVEHLTLKIQDKFNPYFIVSCVYRHTNYLKSDIINIAYMEELFSLHLKNNHDYYVLGDINLPDEKQYNKFIRITDSLNLTQIIDEPTRGKNKLDLILINNPLKLNNKKVLQPHLSDHSLTECTMNYSKTSHKTKVVNYRDFKSINNEILNLKINYEYFSNQSNYNNVSCFK